MIKDFSIRRGTTKKVTFLIKCNCSGTTWSDLGTLKFRLTQGNVTLDKTLVIVSSDHTSAYIKYTQEDTLRFSVGSARGQLFSITGTGNAEVALKTHVYNVEIQESLWDQAVHNNG